MTYPRKLPYSNVLFITNIPPFASLADLKNYLLPTIPLQVIIYKNGSAHVEILRKREAVNILLKTGKRLKGTLLGLFPNKLATKTELREGLLRITKPTF